MITQKKTGTNAFAAKYYSRPLHIMQTDKGPIGNTPMLAAAKQFLAEIAKPESK